MDLARHLAHPVVAEEVLFQELHELERLLVLLPAADLLEELRMELLERLRLPGELLLEPLDGRGLVGDEKLELQNLLHLHALLVILCYLVR